MESLLAALTPLLNLLLVIVGFGLVVFIHELGHFLTARWAGIRVFAFALGFGPALLSYRRGLGWRRGSSEREYVQRLQAQAAGATTAEGQRTTYHGVSPTEYRLNALPFGGYVKMLGQHDLHPEATATAPDSYLAKPIWKRMIVISGGVVMNVLLALAIFMFVFYVGLRTEPAKIGIAYPDGPAASAVAVNADQVGATQTGLRSGDVVLAVNGRKPDNFDSILMAAAMTGPGETVSLRVARAGIAEPLHFEIAPERSQFSNLLEIGIEPARSLTIPEAYVAHAEEWRALVERFGLQGVEPGMRLVAVGDRTDLHSAGDLVEAARASGGGPIALTFGAEDGRLAAVTVEPVPELMLDDGDPAPGVILPVEHLLGLLPVMKVGPLGPGDRGYAQGLREGDIFARLGEVEFPSVDAGIREVRRHAGGEIDVVVLRGGGADRHEVAFTASVSPEGMIGFPPGDTADDSTLVTVAPAALRELKTGAEPYAPAAAGVITRPGTRILSIDGKPVESFAAIREALLAATAGAHAAGAEHASVPLGLQPPLPPQPDGSVLTQSVTLTIPRQQLERLHSLSWELPFSTAIFEPESFVLKASGPIDAVRMGLSRTRQMMVMTYLTLARLVQGTVKVENLKGPVGIAHLGTQVATRGYIWLVFFMGLISINLAVINFLPLPIADGGQFLMLLYEQVRGRPLPIPVQNAVTAAGLVLLVSLFLLVTFNDVARLLGQ
ncbi:MAG TPA: site-2 protease family protein [Phycisphaerales bacterium]|nr:site-2 protease family protein [Phycisphaerales bacterium]